MQVTCTRCRLVTEVPDDATMFVCPHCGNAGPIARRSKAAALKRFGDGLDKASRSGQSIGLGLMLLAVIILFVFCAR